MENLHKSSPKDVFMHLLLVITLYVSSGSLLTLWFQYIDKWFPDPLRGNYGAGVAIRWSLAMLIILFPVFLLVSRFLERDIAKNPDKVNLKTRRWLLYFTLFAASLLIIGDLVALIFNLLEGDFTARFLLKVLVVFLVSGAVFGYYLYTLRKAPGSSSPKAKTFVWGVVLAIIVSIVIGFTVAGSPFKQRLVRFDVEKIGDLQIIQDQIVNYWQLKNVLPSSLDMLRDNISGFSVPTDPQTDINYGYTVTGALSFELCAEFNLSSEDAGLETSRGFSYPEFGIKGDNWEHGVGETCFSRSIDPDLYEPKLLPVR